MFQINCLQKSYYPAYYMRCYKAFWLFNAFSHVTKANQIEPVLRELSPGRIFWTVSRSCELPMTKASQIEPVLRELSSGLKFWTILRLRDQIVTSIYW